MIMLSAILDKVDVRLIGRKSLLKSLIIESFGKMLKNKRNYVKICKSCFIVHDTEYIDVPDSNNKQ